MSNAYTTPLTGRVAYRNAGIIKAVGQYGEKLSVGKIEYQHFDDENFQYVISPFGISLTACPPMSLRGFRESRWKSGCHHITG